MKQPYAAVVAALVSLTLAGCSAAGAAGSNGPEEQRQDAALQRVVAGEDLPAAEGANNRDQEVSGGTGADPERLTHGEAEADGEAAARAVVEEFGRRLKDVSLMAPEHIVAESMEQHYGDLVTPELLERWKGDLAQAPGRVVSSPWPDRIEIVSVVPRAQGEHDGAYEVRGNIVLKTSTDLEDGYSGKRAITLVVARIGDAWMITDVTLGDYVAPGPVTYLNGDYGFVFSLPGSWEGYTIVTEEWEGLPVGGTEPVTTGPLIRIRHPAWREDAPRQDIPIMVFTMDQWEALESGEFHIGAAPIGPNELGRNDEYVFALPARYNFAFPEGYEEVEEILEGDPLQPTQPIPGR